MSSYNATFFLTPQADARGNASVHPVLYIEPDGWHGSGSVVLQMPTGLTDEEQVTVAERILAGVTGWRDEIVAKVERDRTAADELTAARAEIARLKAEAGEME
ncbi:hypothetical protein OG784_13060 [Streptomyces sp. NBC_01617]|uniref:hypothetical protein n=1 Tax=Streptomyces sp. NBC_01617 TaxID=2975899 RepID=UPI0038695C22|nr:hypothetical protein OG784_13060 [Streptomyces sp. NBC_01617]